MNPPTNRDHWFRRLVAADDALASDGLTLRDFARRHRVSTKTVERYVNFLASVCEIEGTEEEFNRRRWRYADRRRRVFQAWWRRLWGSNTTTLAAWSVPSGSGAGWVALPERETI